MSLMIYDLAIIGGGPAGVAAGVYASRKRLKTIFITENFEGQSVVSEGIENWIGTVKISGSELAKNLKNHLLAYAGDVVDIKEGQGAASLTKIKDESAGTADGEVFLIKTIKGDEFKAKTILVTTGSKRRKLEARGVDIFEHKGLTYCASCDGPIFSGMDVVVIGGGNAAFESAAQLSAYCKSVAIINRSGEYRADPVTVTKVLSKENIRAINNAVTEEVKGDKFVNGIVLKDVKTGELTELPISAIFVEIGSIPNTEFLKGVVELDSVNRVITDPKNQQTRTVGVWAAGDVTDGLYQQNNIAAGDAVKALEDIYIHIHAR